MLEGLLRQINVHHWDWIFVNFILYVLLLKNFDAWDAICGFSLLLDLNRIVNRDFCKYFFHFFKLKVVVTVFGSLNLQNIFDGLVFTFIFLMMWSALTGITRFDKRWHDSENFPKFFVVLDCENIRKVIKKHNVFNMLFGGPVPWPIFFVSLL